jgi:protein O-mannosyl-transferase
MHQRMSRRAPKAAPGRQPSAAICAPAKAASWWSRPWFVALALAVGTFAVYAPVLWCDFVGYDDTVYVTENWRVLQGLTWEQVDWAFANLAAGFWHPLTWLSHMLDVQIYGLRAWGHHLTNLLLHAGSTVLLFMLLQRITGFLWRSALVAALFALHPLHVESVAWVAERKDVLSALFGFVSLWFYASYAQSPSGQKESAITNYSLSLLLFGCSLASKSTLVTLPLLMLALDYWPLKRWPGAECGVRSDSQPSRRSFAFGLKPPASPLLALLLEKAPFLALSLASGLLTLHAEKSIGAVATKGGIPLLMRASNAVVSCVRYLEQMVWPVNMAVFYPYPKALSLWLVFGAAFLLVAVTVWVVLAVRRRPYLAVGWFWYLVILLPVSGLIQVGSHSRADRYTYVPLVGIFLMVVWAVGELFSRWRPPKLLVGILAAGVLLACGWRTQNQLRHWRNAESLFSHALAVTKDNYLAYNNVGYYLMHKYGRLDDAMECFRRAISLYPDEVEALGNLGYALAAKGQAAEAITYYQAALRTNPGHAATHNNLANVLSNLGKIDEAIQEYQLALQSEPDYAEAHNNLGIALAQKGRFDEAVAQFRAAIRFKPNYAIAHNGLANVFTLRGQYQEAVPEYQEALRLDPAYAEAQNGLGYALAGVGRFDQAAVHYREALRLNADYVAAHYNLGCALARLDRRDEAIAQLNEALRLQPDYAEAKQKLKELNAPASP